MEEQSSSAANAEASGKAEEVTNTVKDSVSYETFNKLLAQRKKDKEVLKTYEKQVEELSGWKKSIEEQESVKKGEYEKILTTYKTENEALKGKLSEVQKSIVDGQKYNAFLDKLPGRLDRSEYLQFVDIEEIAIDPDTGIVDEATVQSSVDKFVKGFGKLITPTNTKSLPSHDRIGDVGYKPKSIKALSDAELKEAFLKGNL
jgi:hypothetical protein